MGVLSQSFDVLWKEKCGDVFNENSQVTWAISNLLLLCMIMKKYNILKSSFQQLFKNFCSLGNFFTRNEKEGIPVDVLQSLDVCVEIPQLGIIRSLNVHVCGALIVWEYTRQLLQQQEQKEGQADHQGSTTETQ